MFALTGRTPEGSADSGTGGLADRVLVLPRPLRRTARFVRSLIAGDVCIPRYLGTVSVAVLFAATGAAGMVAGGHTQQTFEATGSALGFGVSRVAIHGNVETSDIDVLQQLHLDGDTSIFTLDPRAARKALLDLPWVADAKVRKVYPDAVEVDLKERKAFAIWQHGEDLSLIERSGSVIAPFVQRSRFSDLPHFVGFGADAAASGFDDLLVRWPALASRVRAIVRVGDRRWNLVFDRGITVKLPQTQVGQALEDLDAMQKSRDILGRAVVAVDLRLPDRITVQLTPEAAQTREEALKARDKALKRAEKQAWKIDPLAGKQA